MDTVWDDFVWRFCYSAETRFQHLADAIKSVWSEDAIRSILKTPSPVWREAKTENEPRFERGGNHEE